MTINTVFFRNFYLNKYLSPMLSLRRQILLFLNLFSDEELYYLILKKVTRNIVYNNSWYQNSLVLYNEIQFRTTFRTRKSCLNFIMEMFFRSSSLTDNNKNRLQFHMLIYFASHNITYRALGGKFGVPSTTSFRNIESLLINFNNSIGPIYIKRPVSA